MPKPKFVPGPPPLGNVVMEFKLGDTRVRICDDAYRNRTPEEQRQSLRNVDRIATEAYIHCLTKEAQAKADADAV
jgi:hypothetical protein